MRKRLLTLAVAVLAVLQTAWAYDFSATSPSGHTLYYEIISGTTNVGVVRPGTDSYYDNYVTGNVVIPATVVYNNTTYNVTELRSISDGYYGGRGSFQRCSDLTSVTIPNSVTSIGISAFRDCSGLTSITIPNSVTTIGIEAFRDCRGLTSVTIPNSVTSIGVAVFYNCRGLTSVTIPNSVTYIGERTFSGCSGLTSVTIPNSVTSIGSSAFSYCTGLNSVTIPNSVTSIGEEAFDRVNHIIYNGTATGSPWGALSVNGFVENGFVYSDSTKTSLLAYIGTSTSVTIPNSVTTIGSSAFSGCSGLTSVTIPNSVTSIGERTFSGCSGLTSVTIPNSVTSIGSSAFRGCSSLTTLNFNAINCGDFTYDYYSEYPPFYGCPISTINIGDSVQRIPADFAYNLDSLTSITIPNSVTSIGRSAFSGCSGLTSVTIPNSVTSIGRSAFSGCSGLTSVTIPNSVTSIEDNTFWGCTGLTSVTIPNSVTSIGDYAFYNCSGLTSVTIPNSVTSIGKLTFAGCSGLTSVTIPNSVTSIGGEAFRGCSGLTSVTIPNSVTTIEGYTFYDCIGLTSVTIGNSVASIGNYAFRGCSSLTTLNFNAINCGDFSNYSDYRFYNCPITTINIGDSVQRIPAYFAYNLNSLTSVTIGNSVISIGKSAFMNCNNLPTITIPNSITNMEDSIFNRCFSLREVVSLAVLPPALGANIFSATAILKVPCGSANYYNSASAGWSQYFVGIEEMCDNITITVTSANESMGSVSGGGEYAFGTVATITAIPNQGYRFVSWNDGNTNNPRTITVTENATYIANFEEAVGIESRDMLSELTFYPNPTRGTITFNRTDINKVEVLDAMGRRVAVYENAHIIDVSKLTKGYYTMRITTAEGVSVRKVVRN